MGNFIDGLGRTIILPHPPQSIVSLVPSQTELLAYFNLDKEVSGITKFCVHPQNWFRSKPRIGGTKNINIQKIKELNPDLILANKEENRKEQIEELENYFPVWVSDVNNYGNALQMIGNVGALTGREKEAERLVTKIESSFGGLRQTSNLPACCYLIWKEPYMTVGGDTFISDMLSKAGFQNVFSHLTRYPQINIHQIAESNCELLLLCSEPYPFRQKHVDELRAFLPQTKIALADGEFFSWYGSRLLLARAYFTSLCRQIGFL